MLIRARSIINLPVIEMIGFKKIAIIRDILLDPQSGSILAFLLKKSFFWEKSRMVMAKEINGFFADAVLIQNESLIVEAEEALRIKDIILQKIFFLKSKVITSENKSLGYLEDFIFDQEFLQLMTLIIKKRFSQERRIVSAERIIRVLPKKIIIRDAGIKMPVIKKSELVGANVQN